MKPNKVKSIHVNKQTVKIVHFISTGSIIECTGEGLMASKIQELPVHSGRRMRYLNNKQRNAI